MKPTLHAATESDRAAVRALCERLDPHDYLPEAWDAWLSDPGGEMLLASCDGTLAGCVYAARVAPGEVFSQGLRVHPDYRRLGVATLLMNEQRRRLAAHGIRVARGVTGYRNERARAFFATIGWKEAFVVHRRRLPHWKRSGAPTAAMRPRTQPLLVSREGRAHFRRIYFSADAAWIEHAAREGRWHERNGAYVLLDPPSVDLGTWVVALGGPPAALRSLLEELSPPWREPRGMTVEAPGEPGLQEMLDRLGFDAPGPDDSYVVVEDETAVVGAAALSRGRRGDPVGAVS